jgi:hypothetical protein
MIPLLLALACGPRAAVGPAPEIRHGPWTREGGRVVRVLEVAYRPAPPPTADAKWLVNSVTRGQWDLGLARAAEQLVGAASNKTAALTPESIHRALAQAGFPGAARFGRLVNGGAPPEDLLRGIEDSGVFAKLDVAMASRRYGDGTVLWVVGFAPHLSEIDPLRRDVALDESVMLRADLAEGAVARLFVDRPGQVVEEVTITDGVARWIGGFHVPGEYRFEVLADRDGVSEVVLLFSLFVDTEVPAVPRLRAPPERVGDPSKAETELYESLAKLRRSHGLSPVERFPLFESLAREHSALMGHTGQVAHVIPGTTGGVSKRAAEVAHPRARHHENIAAATSASDAFELVRGSPAHLANLLCAKCTHASIGVALEPVIDRVPRLFVTWELLDFPQGPPREIDHYNR